MAMAFMEPRVQFRNNIFIIAFFVSCGTVKNKEAVTLNWFNADQLVLENKNGIVYNNNIPFSGKICKLQSNKDTLMTAAYFKGKEQGEWKRMYTNGQTEEQRYFDNGKKTKTLTRWWPNGQQQLHCTFENGEYEGMLSEWNANGQLVKQMHYKKGYEEGSQKVYYDNGKIRSNYWVKTVNEPDC